MKDEIILNNLGLITKAMKDMNCQLINPDDFEDYYFSGLVGLIIASKTYDDSKGKSTYLYKGIKKGIMFNFLSRTRKKRDRLNQEISLSTPTNFGELQDIIPDTRRFENEVINKIIVHEALDRLKNTKYKQFIIEYYGIGVPQLNIRELALKYGVSKQSVQQTIKWGLEVLRKEIK